MNETTVPQNGQKVETLFHLSQEYQVRKFAQ